MNNAHTNLNFKNLIYLFIGFFFVYSISFFFIFLITNIFSYGYFLKKDKKTTTILESEPYAEILKEFDAESILISYEKNIHIEDTCYYQLSDKILFASLESLFDIYCIVDQSVLKQGNIKILKENGKWIAYMSKDIFNEEYKYYQLVIDNALSKIIHDYEKTKLNREIWQN